MIASKLNIAKKKVRELKQNRVGRKKLQQQQQQIHQQIIEEQKRKKQFSRIKTTPAPAPPRSNKNKELQKESM